MNNNVHISQNKSIFVFKVHISQRGIKIVSPSMRAGVGDVAIQIPLKEIVRILVHFGKGLPVIFLYTMNKCGVQIRKSLDMAYETGKINYDYDNIHGGFLPTFTIVPSGKWSKTLFNTLQLIRICFLKLTG